LTPDGKKRNPFTYIPFAAGKRSCLGKAFSDFVLKVLLTYLTQSFELEFYPEDKEKFGEGPSPSAFVFQPKTIPIRVNLTKRAI
jgi:cytochrome P450